MRKDKILTRKFCRYHWSLLVGPKKETSTEIPGMRYHVKNTPTQGWKYEEVELGNVRSTK